MVNLHFTKRLIGWKPRAEAEKEALGMIPVQYRDAETEEILDRRYEGSAPEIGARVMLEGVGEARVLYRWRCNPFACVVYVQRARVAA